MRALREPVDGFLVCPAAATGYDVGVPSLLTSATGLAADGFRVHPLQPRGKIPIWEGWQQRATTDVETIADWWTQHPEQNIGIATGNGLVVMDIDAGGRESLETLTRIHGPLPPTKTAKTGRGWHAYFAIGEVVPNSVRKLGVGIDIRGDGGLVVAPPSIHSNLTQYAWQSDRPSSMASLPAEWIALLREAVRHAPLRIEDGELIPSGMRNWELFRHASQLRGLGKSVREIHALISVMNIDRCLPPLTESEINLIVKQAGKYELGENMPPGLITSGTVARALTFATAASVQPEAVDWLWHGFLPRGKLVVQDGDPGLGKSTLWIDLAAKISTGRQMPDGAEVGPPADVILMMNEDGLADTIVPRLMAAGADLSRVHVLRSSFICPDDVPALEEKIRDTQAALVVIDPLGAHLGDSKVDINNDKATKQALSPLTQMAERTGVVIGANRHLTKSREGKIAMMRGMGSVGIVGSARVAWAVAPDPDDVSGETMVMAMTKTNLTKRQVSRTYRLVDAVVGENITTSRIEWIGISGKSAADLIAGDEFKTEKVVPGW